MPSSDVVYNYGILCEVLELSVSAVAAGVPFTHRRIGVS